MVALGRRCIARTASLWLRLRPTEAGRRHTVLIVTALNKQAGHKG